MDEFEVLCTVAERGIAYRRRLQHAGVTPTQLRAALGGPVPEHPTDPAAVLSDPVDWNPEFSRRARGVLVYAALASLGRDGIVATVEGCCAHARAFADALAAEPGVAVLNDVVLNQVLVRFLAQSGRDEDHDARTRAVIAAVQDDGTCWLGGSTWRDQAVTRISVSSAATTADDVAASVAAIITAVRAN